jgi:hypothetical protein
MSFAALEKSKAEEMAKNEHVAAEELQTKVPINDLNKLSLGRYLIGTVIIDDRYFLKYHNNASDWNSPNHPIKKKWNEEVFSTFKEIIKLGKDNRN